MASRNWHREAARITQRDVRRKAGDLDAWLREYGIGRKPSKPRAAPKVAPSLVKVAGSWCAVLPHNDNAAPAVGDVVECTHAGTGRAGQVRVTGTVWSQRDRSLVRVEKL